ncbi:MAG: leucine-rich repeat domain-containing protein [Promethearchaeota archaeon]
MQPELKKAPVIKSYNHIQLVETDYQTILELETQLGKPIPPRKSLNWNLFGYTHRDRKIVGLALYLKNLMTILPSIDGFAELEDLWLAENSISVIPAVLGNLSHLRKISLNSNKLMFIPEIFGQFEHLEILDLANNKISGLPEIFERMTKLTKLNLSGNQISSLPDSIGQCEKLVELQLKNNQIQTLPGSIGSLTKLTTLDAQTNNLEEIPASIVHLTQLQNLYLDHNPQLSVSEDQLRWMAELEQNGCFIQTDFERSKPTIKKPPVELSVEVQEVAEPIKKTKKKNWFQRLFRK